MASKKVVTFANRSSVKISEWKIEVGQTIYHGRVLLVYEEDSSGKLSKLKSKCVGTVVNLLAKAGETLNPGDPVLEVEEGCSHPTVINDLCAECGADLQREGVSESNATVPMVHHIPQLKVSQQEAEMIGKADTERLLKDRKLVLLVDLDQTLIHTTHDNIPNNIKDVHHFQLGTSAWYHTRLRPNTAHFLKEMSAYFELHICTFGVRPYAHMVANILDRDQSLFSSRILSRDECFSFDSKVANLQALFPNGDELVCIIDDRKDVWNNSPNLIPVKPYVFFTNTGDINDANLPPITKHSDFFAKGVKLKKRNGGAEGSEAETEPKETEKGHPEEFDVEDEDDYLLYLETILKKVHSLFYKVYDKEVEGTAHVRWVLEQLRGGVLKGCEIVFSGLVPLHEGLEHSEPYLIATDLGATIGKTVSATTTHLVAAREGTAKLHESKKHPNIKIVNPQWLTTCLYRWEKVDERLFPLTKGKEKNSVPLSLTFDDVMSMQQEVQAEFNSDSSDSVDLTAFDVKVEGDTEGAQSENNTVIVKAVKDEPITEDIPSDIEEPVAKRTGKGDVPNDKTETSQSKAKKELLNLDKLIASRKRHVQQPVHLDFLKANESESLKNFHIPKRVRIDDNPQVRLIESRRKDPVPPGVLLKVALECKKNKLENSKKAQRTHAPSLKKKAGVVKEQTKQNHEEPMAKTRHFTEELKNHTEYHRQLMRNAYEEHTVRMEQLNQEHATKMSYLTSEHEAKMTYLIRQHETVMSNLCREHEFKMINFIDHNKLE